MSKEIIVAGLSWNNSLVQQQNAIKRAVDAISSNQLQFSDLFTKDKSTWENFCKIVQGIGYPANRPAIPTMFMLLQDVNWPGAYDALAILVVLGKNIILYELEKTIRLAFVEQDSMWLAGLKMLVEQLKLSPYDFNDQSVFEMLQSADF